MSGKTLGGFLCVCWSLMSCKIFLGIYLILIKPMFISATYWLNVSSIDFVLFSVNMTQSSQWFPIVLTSIWIFDAFQQTAFVLMCIFNSKWGLRIFNGIMLVFNILHYWIHFSGTTPFGFRFCLELDVSSQMSSLILTHLPELHFR